MAEFEIAVCATYRQKEIKKMSIYGFLRLMIFPIFCALYICYQLLVKKKGWQNIKGDIYISLFILAACVFISYLLI
jgi:hypothetical protein